MRIGLGGVFGSQGIKFAQTIVRRLGFGRQPIKGRHQEMSRPARRIEQRQRLQARDQPPPVIGLRPPPRDDAIGIDRGGVDRQQLGANVGNGPPQCLFDDESRHEIGGVNDAVTLFLVGLWCLFAARHQQVGLDITDCLFEQMPENGDRNLAFVIISRKFQERDNQMVGKRQSIDQRIGREQTAVEPGDLQQRVAAVDGAEQRLDIVPFRTRLKRIGMFDRELQPIVGQQHRVFGIGNENQPIEDLLHYCNAGFRRDIAPLIRNELQQCVPQIAVITIQLIGDILVLGIAAAEKIGRRRPQQRLGGA